MISMIGELVGDYRLEMTIGTGSLGETFRAHHATTGELAAVKIMNPVFSAEPSFSERFDVELRALTRVQHPHLLPIKAFGQHKGKHYIVMAFARDGSVRTLQHRRDTQLPLRRAVEIAIQSAEALAAAHALGIWHRDVKPENILVEIAASSSVAGVQVQLADLSLTKLAESSATIGGTLSIGSLPYMSPEHLRGLTEDGRSDIYSLGVVLYEMATGHPPFQVRTIGEALEKHMKAVPPAPRSIAKDLPPSLEQVILRCLEKESTLRFQTATELATALRHELEGLSQGPAVVLVEHRPAPPPPSDGPIIVLRDSSAAPAEPEIVAEPEGPKRYRVRMDGGAAPAPPKEPVQPEPSLTDRYPQIDLGRAKLRRDGEAADRPTLPDDRAARDRPVVPRAPLGESKRIRVALDKDSLTLTPGQQAVMTVTVVNSGRTVDHFPVTVEGVPESWIRTPVQPQQLNPGQRAVVPLTIVVPRAPESRAGTYPVTVRARSRDVPGESGSAAALWTVMPFGVSELTLEPSRVRAWRRATLSARLRNLGNSKARYALSASDVEQQLGYNFTNRDVELEPGASISVPLSTEARLRLIGSPEERAFQVRAEVRGDGNVTNEPPQIAAGQLVHRALIPLWVPPLLMLLVIAAVLLLRGRGELTITVVPSVVQIGIGGEAPLVATVANRNKETVAGLPITWRSQDSTIAAVSDSGIVTARREGATVVTVMAGKASTAVQVSVVPARVESVALTPRALRLTVGGSAMLRATAKDGAGHALPRDPNWQTSDPTVVTVGGNGRITAKAPGVATITAQVENKSATADVAVAAPAIGTGGGGGTPDCTEYDPAALRILADKALGWTVTDGSSTLLTLDNDTDARKALALARRFRGHCFLGRGNTRPNRSDYIIEFWVAPTHVPTVIDAEDCVPYDRGSLRIAEAGAAGLTVGDRTSRLFSADTKADAQKAWEVAEEHNALCFIGRGNRRPNQRDYIVQYLK